MIQNLGLTKLLTKTIIWCYKGLFHTVHMIIFSQKKILTDIKVRDNSLLNTKSEILLNLSIRSRPFVESSGFISVKCMSVSDAFLFCFAYIHFANIHISDYFFTAPECVLMPLDQQLRLPTSYCGALVVVRKR